jgi:hypothetical protein
MHRTGGHGGLFMAHAHLCDIAATDGIGDVIERVDDDVSDLLRSHDQSL